MNVKEIRQLTGLTQREFAEKYGVPLQTIKQWESAPGSKSFRKPPEYVVDMLARVVSPGKEEKCAPKTKVEHVIEVAHECKTDAKLWFRYLRKEFDEGRPRLSKKQIEIIIDSNELSMFQEVSLKRAMQEGTVTNDYVVGLNQRAKIEMVDEIRRRMNAETGRDNL